MATTDVISGLVSVAINIASRRTNPDGRDNYKFSYSQNFENTESVGDATAGKLFAVFSEEITVTNTSKTLSLADSVDPLGDLGSNVPSSDPEGGLVKILGFLNKASPGAGQNIYIGWNDGAINDMIGPLTTYISAGAPPSGAAIVIGPGGCALFVDPTNNMTTALSDGVDDEIKVITDAGTAPLHIFYAVG